MTFYTLLNIPLFRNNFFEITTLKNTLLLLYNSYLEKIFYTLKWDTTLIIKFITSQKT